MCATCVSARNASSRPAPCDLEPRINDAFPAEQFADNRLGHRGEQLGATPPFILRTDSHAGDPHAARTRRALVRQRMTVVADCDLISAGVPSGDDRPVIDHGRRGQRVRPASSR